MQKLLIVYQSIIAKRFDLIDNNKIEKIAKSITIDSNTKRNKASKFACFTRLV